MISGAHVQYIYFVVSTLGTHAGVSCRAHTVRYQRRETRQRSYSGHATEITGPISPAGIYGRRDFALLEPFTVFAL